MKAEIVNVIAIVTAKANNNSWLYSGTVDVGETIGLVAVDVGFWDCPVVGIGEVSKLL